MKKIVRMILSMMIAIACVFTLLPQTQVLAATTITDNYTKDTAYTFGSWSSINSSPTVILDANAQESWFKLTVAGGEHIYIRTSTNKEYVGMKVQVKDSNGVNVGKTKQNPDNIIDSTGVAPGLYIDVDNSSTSSKTFYLVVSRGDSYESSMYFGLSAANRIRTGTGTFAFTGTATNPGNASFNPNGVDSNILSLNLTNNTGIPNGAVATRIGTSGTQSPSQGNVHHMIMPASSNIWYKALAANASSGLYSISLTDNYAAKQVWYYKYNALAGAKSTMKNVSIKVDFQYDMNQTNYQIFIK
jgi:hypothetical protein